VCLTVTLSKFTTKATRLSLLLAVAHIGYAAEENPLLSFALQDRIQDVYKSFHSAIVRIKATRQNSADEQQPVSRVLKMGTGFIVSKDGHVLTSGLLQQPDRIWVEHDKSFLSRRIVG